jgi:putative addiction module killer protein
MTSAIEIRRYVTVSGKDIFGDWLSALKDARTQGKIVARIDRLAVGNFGDCKALGGRLFELRIDWGPGYRVYYAMVGRTCVLLLCGGDKKRQPSDIRRAREYLKDYWERSRETEKN